MRLPDSRFSLTTEPERFNDLAWDLLPVSYTHLTLPTNREV